MATANLFYENRCIFVSDEDFEDNNLPLLDKKFYRNKQELLYEQPFEFFDITLNIGYYEGGCIDYTPKKVYQDYSLPIEDKLSYWWSYNTKKELINDVTRIFNISEYKVHKIIGNMNEYKNFDDFMYFSFEKLNEYFSELEREKVEKYLDKLRDDYGYDELCCVAQFSNGETFYEKIK